MTRTPIQLPSTIRKRSRLMSSRTVTAPDRFLTVDGTTFAYRSFGRSAGTPVVFLSRFRGTMDDWDPALIDPIAEERPVILFDNQGVGRTDQRAAATVTGMASAAASFIGAVAEGPVDVLGFSLGGYVAQRLVLARPDLVRRIVLAGTGPGAGDGILPSEPQVAPLRSIPEMTLDAFRVLFFTDSEAGIRAGDGMWERIHLRADPEPAVSADTVEQQIAAIRNWSGGGEGGDSAYPELARIQHPILVANGHRDVMIPTPNSFLMSQRLPNAELHIYPDSGHGFLFQYPAEFASLVNDFLGRTSARATS